MSNGDRTDEATPHTEQLPAARPKREDRSVGAGENENEFPPALRSLIELERERIDSANRRTEVVRFAIESNDASDKRQFEFRMAELEAGRASSARRHTLAQKVVFSATGIGVVILALLFGMAFFGNPDQSAVAIKILEVSGVGIGGYGLIGAVVRATSQLFKEK